MKKAERYRGRNGRRFNEEEKKGNKKFIIFFFILIVIIAGGIYYFNNKPGLEKKEIATVQESNTISDELLNEKEFNGLKIKNISLDNQESASYFKCILENTSEAKYIGEDVYFVFIKNDNSELARFKYHIDDIEKDDNKKISITTTNKLVGASNFYIESK